MDKKEDNSSLKEGRESQKRLVPGGARLHGERQNVLSRVKPVARRTRFGDDHACLHTGNVHDDLVVRGHDMSASPMSVADDSCSDTSITAGEDGKCNFVIFWMMFNSNLDMESLLSQRRPWVRPDAEHKPVSVMGTAKGKPNTSIGEAIHEAFLLTEEEFMTIVDRRIELRRLRSRD
ncbi:hypothetical protein EJ110_NYTH56021 [Nymphaea thermarum]|nr:hypothetical protein EJ110_NYTH56021 [Nymphaea thermarum]